MSALVVDGPYSDRLARRASEARALWRCLQVRCPDPKHAHAVALIPCYPPSEEHPTGWVCVSRHAREIDTRDERDEARQAAAQRERSAQRAERRANNASRARARITARIAEAAQRPTTEEDR